MCVGVCVLMGKKPPCPECKSSNRVIKHGLLVTRKGTFQRYKCLKCGGTFTPREKPEMPPKGIDQYAESSESEVNPER